MLALGNVPLIDLAERNHSLDKRLKTIKWKVQTTTCINNYDNVVQHKEPWDDCVGNVDFHYAHDASL